MLALAALIVMWGMGYWAGWNSHWLKVNKEK